MRTSVGTPLKAKSHRERRPALRAGRRLAQWLLCHPPFLAQGLLKRGQPREAMNLPRPVPVKRGSLREEPSPHAEQAASVCARPRQRAVCVICGFLFLKPARTQCQNSARAPTGHGDLHSAIRQSKHAHLLRAKRRDRVDAHSTTRRNEARDRNHEHEYADDAA
jgi:hypothetical protein